MRTTTSSPGRTDAGLIAALLILSSFLSGMSLPIGSLDVRPEHVAAPLALLAALFLKRPGRPPVLAALAVLWIAAGVFGAFGQELAGRSLVHAARLIVTVLPVALLPILLPGRREAERAWDLFLGMAALTALAGVLALASFHAFGTTWGVTEMRRLGYVHPQGPLLEPNLLGMLSAAAAAALSLRALEGRAGTRGVVALVVLLLATGLSVTRSAWIALPAAVAVSFAARRLLTAPRPLRELLRLAAAFVLLAAAAALVVSSLDLGALASSRTGLLGKLASLGRLGEDPNVSIRLRSYAWGLSLFRESPILGMGHGSLERFAGRVDDEMAWAGNLEVHLLADTGMLGLALVLVLFAAVLVRSFQESRGGDGEADAPVPGGCGGRSAPAECRGGGRALERVAALLVLFACSQTTDASWLASFWVLLGLALAADRPADPAAERTAAGNPPARILFVHPSDELYGSDRVLLDLATTLDRSRFSPRVLISTDVAYAGRLSRRLQEAGVPVHRLRIGVLRRRVLTSPARLLRFGFDLVVSTARIATLLLRERVDIVHANTVTVFPAALAARLLGVPVVWHLHEIVADRPGRGALLGLMRVLATRVVTVSHAAREQLGSGAKAEVIPNGVAPRPALPFPAGPPVLACVGRLSRRKGPDVLVRAAARLLPSRPGARVVFTGDEFGGGSELTDELKALAHELGIADRVAFVPFREDVSDAFAEATALVSASVEPESFGLVLLEAMASGRPVVASDLGGPRELVLDGQTGFLVPPGDDEALARVLAALCDEPSLASRLGAAARARALTTFSLASQADRFEELWSSVLRGERALRLDAHERAQEVTG